ncbi:MAG TPA: hypothetical protein VLQ93_17540 [Myxococcaceae bacterium]|nr:hypothetical protein [Myxococcaceae bacterium]
MRLLLFIVALLAAGAAGWLGTLGRTPYAPHSAAQLDQLEAEHARLLREARGPEASVHQLSLQLIAKERRRPLLLGVTLGVAGLAFVAALLLPGSLLPLGRASLSDEESRLLAALGDPEVAHQGARHKAAELLGVSLQASPAEIEAAVQARLAERDPARLEGLAPDLHRLARQQREDILRAGNLLLGRAAPPPRT